MSKYDTLDCLNPSLALTMHLSKSKSLTRVPLASSHIPPPFPLRYATGMASVTALYHLHTCFNLQRSVVSALSSAGTSDKAVGIASEEWWVGRGILLALSMGLQKIPMTILNALHRVEETARNQEANPGGRRCVPRWYPVVPWCFWGIAVTSSFLITVILTAKGLLGTSDIGETGVPCQCRGIAGGSNKEADWLLLVCMTMIFKWLIYQPIILFAATCLHLRAANKVARKMVATGSGSQVRPQGTIVASEGGVGRRVGGSGRPGGPHIGRDVEMIDLAEKDGCAMMSNPMRSVDNPLRFASRFSSTAPMLPIGNRPGSAFFDDSVSAGGGGGAASGGTVVSRLHSKMSSAAFGSRRSEGTRGSTGCDDTTRMH